MNTKLTEKEMQALAGYERELQAAKDDYLRSMGRQGGILLHEIYHRVTGEHFQRTDVCGHCELRLQKIVAGWYFSTKQARFEAAIAASHDDLDVFVRKYEITYEEAKAAAERIGVEVVDGKVPATKYEEICQEVREHVLGLPGGFNADGLTLDEIHEAKAAAKTMTEPVEECDENTVPKPKKSTRKAAKK